MVIFADLYGLGSEGSKKKSFCAMYSPFEQDYVCDRCFADPALIKFIRAKGRLGQCPWCGARKSRVINAVKLAEPFREVVSIYHQDDSGGGDEISFLLQQDWNIFSRRIERKGLTQEMAVAILTADLTAKDLSEREVDYSGSFLEEHPYSSTLEEHWYEEVDRLLPKKRGPVKTTKPYTSISSSGISDVDRIEFAIEDLGLEYQTNTPFYRARIHDDRKRKSRFALKDLGAPSPSQTKAQRANRAGVPVLYLATDIQTALAEVRAWKGAAIAIGTMRAAKPVKVLNLTERYHIKSPFFLDPLAWHIEVNALLNRFGAELARPVIPHEAHKLYIPTQHLCDLVKRARFDGIAYPSAMGLGHNVVLFDPSLAKATNVGYHRVTKLALKTCVINDRDELYDEWPWDDS